MNYQWDTNKAKANLKKHSVDFADAVTVFGDETDPVAAVGLAGREVVWMGPQIHLEWISILGLALPRRRAVRTRRGARSPIVRGARGVRRARPAGRRPPSRRRSSGRSPSPP